MIQAEGAQTELSSRARAPARARGEDSEVNASQLRAFVERVERLHEERKALAEDISEVYAEAKGQGFDVKVIRAVIKYRSEDRDKRAEMDTLLDLYLRAIGEG